MTGFPQMTRSKPTGELVPMVDFHWKKRRYENASQGRSYWLGTMGLSNNQHVGVSNHKKALLAGNIVIYDK